MKNIESGLNGMKEITQFIGMDLQTCHNVTNLMKITKSMRVML